MDAQCKKNKPDNIIDDALENFIADKELQVSEEGSINTNIRPNELCDGENSGQKNQEYAKLLKSIYKNTKKKQVG